MHHPITILQYIFIVKIVAIFFVPENIAIATIYGRFDHVSSTVDT